MLGRRAFAVHDVRPDHGRHGGVRVRGPRAGDRGWPALRARDALDTVEPLAGPFPSPGTRRAACCSRRLRQRAAVRAGGAAAGTGLQLDYCLAARARTAVRASLSARRNGRSGGRRYYRRLVRRPGRVDRPDEQIIREARTDVIYACAPRAGAAESRRSRAGTTSPCRRRWTCHGLRDGVCMGVRAAGPPEPDGITRIVRSCWTARFPRDLVRWTTWGRSRSTRSAPPAVRCWHGIALCRLTCGPGRPGRTANLVLSAAGCAGAGRELAQFIDVARVRRR